MTIVASARVVKVFGGRYLNIEVAAGAVHCGFFGIIYNRAGIVPVGTFLSGETTTHTSGCVDEKNNKRGPYSQTNVPVGTGTFTYTNTSGNMVYAFITGGVVSSVNISRNGVDNPIANLFGQYVLAPGDGIRIASTTAPNLQILSM
jgi:hypothetical protein